MAKIFNGRSILKGSTDFASLTPWFSNAYAAGGYKPQFYLDFVNKPSRVADQTTFSRAGLATMVDSDGLLQWAPHNLLSWSESFGDVAWTKSGGGTGTAPIVTENFAAAPDGSITADRVQFSQGLGVTSGDYSLILRTTSLSAALYTDGLWIRSNTGENQTLLVYNSGNGVGIEWTVTPDWTLVQLADSDYADSNYSSGVPSLVFGIRGGGGSRYFTGTNTPQTADVLVWGGHMYRSDLGGMVNNPATGDSYVPTEGSPVYLPRVGHHVYEDGEWVNKGLLLESAAATNLFLNDNLSNVITVTSGATYTASVYGSGTVTVSGVGSATADSPLTFVAPLSSIIVTKSVQSDIAQVEAGAIATSPIPTTTSQATRAAETLSIPATNLPWTTSGALSLAMSGEINYADNNVVNEVLLVSWLRSTSTFISVNIDTNSGLSGNLDFLMLVGGAVSRSQSDILTPSANTPLTFCATYSNTFIAAAANGAAFTTSATSTALADLSATDMQIGPTFNGTIAQLRYWNKDIGSEGLQEATNGV